MLREAAASTASKVSKPTSAAGAKKPAASASKPAAAKKTTAPASGASKAGVANSKAGTSKERLGMGDTSAPKEVNRDSVNQIMLARLVRSHGSLIAVSGRPLGKAWPGS